MNWYEVCEYGRLRPEFGVRALVEGRHVALFRTRDEQLFAVADIDPFCGASVISRGIVGDRGGEPTVSSPMLKQVFSLRTGQCLDDAEVRLTTYPVRCAGDVVEVAVADPSAGADARFAGRSR